MSQKMIKLYHGVPLAKVVSKEFIDILDANGIEDLDTGGSYMGGEEAIGEAGLASRFKVHTKTKGYAKGTMGEEGVLTSISESLKKLGTEKVDIYYLHTPDTDTPITETLGAIQKAYEAGAFQYFGLSNFLAHQVQEVHDICVAKNYVLPTVYQGNYNPFGRHAESSILPLLRKLNISFVAYAVLASGFLTKSSDFFTQESTSSSFRWNPKTNLGQFYQLLYNKPTFVAALTPWEAISKKYGIGKAGLAFRWVAFNSALKPELGDGMILGATETHHLTQALGYLKDGPLEKEVVDEIEGIWESVKEEAILDNFNATRKE